MKTSVIILSQGRQERMGDSITGPKQLLPLPACGNAPILHRTLVQLAHLLWGTDRLELAGARAADATVTVVGWHEVFVGLKTRQVRVDYHRTGNASLPVSGDEVLVEIRPGTASLIMLPEMVSLLSPGNSSLKGIHAYLESQALIAGVARADRTVVLLGDVVYSWECLGVLLHVSDLPHVFTGTSDISPAGGELWGLAWTHNAELVMLEALDRALAKHPPYQTTYQPGQMRRWMWALHPSLQTTRYYGPIDDYTMDVDLPEHVPMLQRASELAREDDRSHGLVW